MTLALKPEVLKHIVDAHCHPTDAQNVSDEAMERLDITICPMSSMKSDQDKVAQLATKYPSKVIPSFGYHPWFSYLISLEDSISKEEHYRRVFLNETGKVGEKEQQAFVNLLNLLPTPTPLASVLEEIREHLKEFPRAMVGEVGLDRVFRVPYDYFAAKRVLSPFAIPLGHQIAVLEAQVELAIEMKRNVSLHSVKSQAATREMFDRLAKRHGEAWYAISIDLHSCGFSPEMWRDIERRLPNVFLSLSTVINGRHSKCEKLISACAPDRILVESDFNDIAFVTERTVDMVRLISEIKGWPLEQVWEEDVEEESKGAVRRLRDNWDRFRKGNHKAPVSKGRRAKRLLDSESEEENVG